MSNEQSGPQSPSAEQLAKAMAMPGVADLMRLYEQQARIVEAAGVYISQVQARAVITVGAGTTANLG